MLESNSIGEYAKQRAVHIPNVSVIETNDMTTCFILFVSNSHPVSQKSYFFMDTKRYRLQKG